MADKQITGEDILGYLYKGLYDRISSDYGWFKRMALRPNRWVYELGERAERKLNLWQR